MQADSAQQQGLYRPEFDHDACGIGALADINGERHHQILDDALSILVNLEHRGGTGLEKNTGDGAGILFQVPHHFFRKEAQKCGQILPAEGDYGVAMLFFPQDDKGVEDARRVFEEGCAEAGVPLLFWREVPVDPHDLGETARACMPTILIPTTAGTGSEMTSNAVLNDPITDSKQGTVSDYLYAKVVLLDPELTAGLPPFYTAITGLDALVHCIESYVSLHATPFTDALNLQAMRMISDNIRKVYANGGNMEAREQMLYGAAISGMGFSNTQNGIIHALGMSVPSEHHIPHGLMMAVCAPMGMSFNALAAPEKFAVIAEILGSAPAGASMREKAKSAAAGFVNLMDDLGIKQGLSNYGIRREELRGVAELGAAYKRLMDSNPRKGTADVLEKLLEQFY